MFNIVVDFLKVLNPILQFGVLILMISYIITLIVMETTSQTWGNLSKSFRIYTWIAIALPFSIMISNYYKDGTFLK
jgi:hypothetical protein